MTEPPSWGSGLPSSIAAEVAGWVGALLVLASYALVSLGRIGARTRENQWINIVGGAALAWNGLVHGAWPSVALNAVWGVVGLTALVGIMRTRAQ